MWRSYFFCSFCQLSKKELESNPKEDWAEVLGGSLPISLCVGHLCGTFLVLLPATAQFDSIAQCKNLSNSVRFYTGKCKKVLSNLKGWKIKPKLSKCVGHLCGTFLVLHLPQLGSTTVHNVRFCQILSNFIGNLWKIKAWLS